LRLCQRCPVPQHQRLDSEKSGRKDEIQTTPPEASQASRARNGSALRRTILGAQGLRAGWSVLLFLAIYQLFETAAMTALGHFVSLKSKGSIPPGLALIRESCEVLVVLSATSLMARIEKRRPLSFGYIGDRKIIRLLSGMIWGLVCLSVLVGVLCKTGFMVIDGRSLGGFSAWKYALAITRQRSHCNAL
jgi:hypothetical protein